MLQTFRKGAKSWLAKGLMMALAAAFGLWGINDIFRGAGQDTTVASIGETQISTADFERRLRLVMRNQSEGQQTNLTMEQAREQGLAQAVLDRMVREAALSSQAQTLGLTADNDMVVSDIRNMPQFQSAGGTFNRALMNEALQQNGLNEAMFAEEVRQDIVRTQLINATAGGIVPPPGLSLLLFEYLNQTRTVEYIVLTPADAGTVREPTEAELAQYHKANAAHFSTPEYRELEYVSLTADQFADRVKVTDEDLKREFEARKETYVKPEQREIEQISFPSKEAADAAEQKIRAGTDFLALAHGMGLKDEDVKLGTFSKSGLDPKLTEAAFALPQAGVTPPVQGPFGWVILRVTKITPGESKTFEELKDTLREQVAKAKATEQMIEAANAFEDARASGDSLEQAAGKLGLPYRHIPAVDGNGLAPNGSKAEVPAHKEFLAQAFRQEGGEEGDLFQVDQQNSFVVRVMGVKPPVPRPLADVREQVAKEWSEAERKRMLAERVKNLLSQAQRDGSLANAAQSLGRQPAAAQAVQRDKPDDIFSSALLAQAFAAAPGVSVSGPLGKGEGIVLARTVRIETPDPAGAYANFNDSRRQLAEQMAGDVAESMSASARNNQGARVNEAAMNRVLGGTQ